MFRNVFHNLILVLPPPAEAFRGYKVFVSDDIGYSGNAKNYKSLENDSPAEQNSTALTLSCWLTDPSGQKVITQCLTCREYFESQNYFKSCPKVAGKIILVKNRANISVESGSLRVQAKLMCCSRHHDVDFLLLHASLAKRSTGEIVFEGTRLLNVKQWRKTRQPKCDCILALERHDRLSPATEDNEDKDEQARCRKRTRENHCC